MAIDWKSRLSGGEVAAPAGYEVSAGRSATDVDWGQRLSQANRTPKWLTGGQLGGMANGYDTPFYRTMFSQMEEAAAEGMSGKGVYARKDYTGIIGHDAMEDRKVGLEASGKFGDIFENGRRVGNLYDSYSKDEADFILLELIGDKTQKEKAYGKGTPEAISSELERARKKATQDATGYLTQSQYQQAIDREQQKALNDEAFTAGSIAAGAAGGAGVGLGLGAAMASGAAAAAGATGTAALLAPFTGGLSLGVAGAIAAGGAAIGGLGAWLNRDQITEEVARANAQAELDGVGTSTGLKNWSTIVQKSINPTSNLYQGLYDVAKGDVGDAKSEFYEMDEKTGRRKASGLAQVAGFGTGFVDAVGMANPVVGGIFQASMTGQILGKAGELTVQGGSTFDERQGIFRNVYTDDEANAAAAWGSAAIDLAQVGLFKGLSKGMKSRETIGEWNEIGKFGGVTQRTPKGAEFTTEMQGLRFFGKRNADGTIEVMDTIRRPISTFLAPSELVSSMPPRFAAMRAAAKNNKAFTGDDVYRTALSLATSKNRTIPMAIINGYGEATEESIQAVLDPISLGYGAPDGLTILEAAAQGFAMGAGMSVGMGANARRFANQRFKAYEATAKNINMPHVLDEEQWNRLSRHEQNLLFQEQPLAHQFLTDRARAMRTDMVGAELATAGELAARRESEEYLNNLEAGKLNSKSSSKMQLSGTTAGTYRSDAAVMGIDYAVQMLRAHAIGRADELKEYTGEDAVERAYLAQASATAESLLETVSQASNAFHQLIRDGKHSEARSLLKNVNRFIEAQFDGADIDEGADNASVKGTQRGATLLLARYPLDSKGSVLMFVPQLGFEYSRDRVMNGVTVSHAVLTLLSGDYDGDTLSSLQRRTRTLAQFEDGRSGQSMLNVDGQFTLYEREYAPFRFRDLYNVLTLDLKNAPQASAANKFLRTIRDRLKTDFKGAVPRRVLKEAYKQFEVEVRADNSNAYKNLRNYLVQQAGDSLFKAGRETGKNYLLRFDEVMMKALNEFQWEYATILSVDAKDSKYSDVALEDMERNFAHVGALRTRRSRMYATDSATLSNVVEGATQFRKYQRIYFVPTHSTVRSSYEYVGDPDTRALQDYYGAMQNDISEFILDQSNPRLSITNMIWDRMMRFTADAYADNPEYRLGPVLLAQMPMHIPTRMNQDGKPNKFRKGGTLLQSLAWSVIEARKARGDMTEAEEAEVKQFTRLLQSGSEFELLIRVAESVQLADLGGSTMALLGMNLTLGQLLRKLVSMSPDARREVLSLWRNQPEYTESAAMKGSVYNPFTDVERVDGKDPRGLLPYRVVVDALAEVANNEAPYNPETGLVGGRTGDATNATSRLFHSGFHSVVTGIQRTVGISTKPTVEQVRKAKILNTDIDTALAKAIPVSARGVVFQLNKDGTVRTAPWVDKMFTMDAAKAEVYFWSNIQLAEFTALGIGAEAKSKEALAYDRGRIKNRFSLLLFDLNMATQNGDPKAALMLQSLLEKMDSALSLNELIAHINKNGYLDVNEVPLSAWVLSRDKFDPNVSGLEPESFADAEMRTALEEVEKVAKRFEEHAFTEAASKEDGALAAKLLNESLARRKKKSRQLQNVEALVKRSFMQDPVIGANAMFQHAFATLRGIDKDSHTKGKTPQHTTAYGTFQQKHDHGQWGSPIEKTVAGLTSVDIEDMTANLSVLSKDKFSLTLPSGQLVEWDIYDVTRYFLKYWQDVNKRPALRAIFLPTVWDAAGENGALERFSLGPTTLSDIAKNDYIAGLFSPTASQKDYFSTLTHFVDTQGEGVSEMTFLLDAFSIAQTSSKTYVMGSSAYQKTIRDTQQFLTRVSKLVGQSTSKELEDLKKATYVTLGRNLDFDTMSDRSKFYKRILEEFAKQQTMQKREQIEATKDALWAELDEAETDAQRYEIQERIAEYAKASGAAALDSEKLAEVQDRFNLDRAVRKYGLGKKADKGPDSTDERVKNALAHYLADHWASLVTMAQSDVKLLNNFREGLAFSNRLDEAATEKEKKELRKSEAPTQAEFSHDEWFDLSKIVITHQLQSAYTRGPMSTEVGRYPGKGQAESIYFDDTFSYLADMLFDSESAFVKGSKALWTSAKQERDHEVQSKLAKEVDKFLGDRKRFGRWDMSVAVHTQKAAGDLRASGGTPATQEAGNSPKMDYSLMREADRTAIDPGAELLSETAIKVSLSKDGDVFLPKAPWAVSIPVKVGETTQQAEASLRTEMLQGAAVAGMTVTIGGRVVQFPHSGGTVNPSATDATASGGIFNDMRYVDREGRTLPYKMMSVEALKNQLPMLLRTAQYDDGSKVIHEDTVLQALDIELQLQYFHPDSQPAIDEDYFTFGNSIAFEGVIGENGADTSPSLIASMDLLVGAMMQFYQSNALQAPKKGGLAMVNPDKVKYSSRALALTHWNEDLSKVLEELTSLGMKVKMAEGEPLDPSYRKGLAKRLRLAYWVRGTQKGKAVLLSSDQVIHYQRSGVALESLFDEGTMELVPASPAKLRTMFGELGDQGLSSKPGVPDFDTEYIPAGRTPIEEILKNDPSLSDFTAKEDAMDWLMANVGTSRRYTSTGMFSLSDSSTINKRFNRLTEKAAALLQSRAKHLDELTQHNNAALDKIRPVVTNDRAFASSMDFDRFGLGVSLDREAEMRTIETFVASLPSGYSGGLVQYFEWVAQNDSPAASYGVMTQLNLFGKAKARREVGVNDWVFINAASFEDGVSTDEQQLRNLHKVLQSLTNSGANIVLLDSGAGRELRSSALTYLNSMDYTRQEENDFVWSYDPYASMYQNELADLSRQRAQHSVPAQNFHFGIVSDTIPVDEGQQWVKNPSALDREVRVTYPVLPVASQWNFNLPRGEDAKQLKAKLALQLSDPAFVDHLLELSDLKSEGGKKKLVRQLKEYKEWAISTADLEDVIQPNVRFGNIIPMWNPITQSTFLYRWGHETNFEELTKQLNASYETGGVVAKPSVGIASGKMSAKHTAYEGELQALHHDGAFGWRIEIDVPLSKWMDKVASFGAKLTNTPMAFKNLLPKTSMFEERDVTFIVNDGAVTGKEVPITVTNMQKAFMAFGLDTEAAIARTLLGIDIGQLTTKAEKDTVRGQVASFMTEYARSTPKHLFKDTERILKDLRERKSTNDLVADLLSSVPAEAGVDLESVRNSLTLIPKEMALDEYITLVSLIYLNISGNQWSDIASFKGLAHYDGTDRDAVVHSLSQSFTNMFDAMELGSKARSQMFQRFRQHFNTDEYYLNEDWTLSFRGYNKGKKGSKTPIENTGFLTLAEWYPTGDNPVLFEQAEKRRSHDRSSLHNNYLQSGIFGDTELSDETTWRVERFNQAVEEAAEYETVFNVFNTMNKNMSELTEKFKVPRKFTPGELNALQFQYQAVRAMRQKIDTSKWKEGKREEFELLVGEILSAYGIDNLAYSYLGHYWVRQYVGMLVASDGRNADIGAKTAINAAKEVLSNAKQKRLPTFNAQVPFLYLEDLRIIFRMNQGSGARFLPNNGKGDQISQDDWDAWVNMAMGEEAFNHDTVIDPLFLTAVDGVLNSYMDLGGDFSDLPVSMEVLKMHRDSDGQLKVSVSAPKVDGLRTEHIYNAHQTTLDELIKSPRLSPDAKASLKETGKRSRRNWRKEVRAADMAEVTTADIAATGALRKKELGTDNALIQGLIQLRVITTLGNPALAVSALGEARIWGWMSDIANLITGDSSSVLANAWRSLEEKGHDKLGTDPLSASGLSQANIAKMRKNERIVGQLQDFRRMIYGDTYFTTPQGRGPITRTMGAAANFVSKLQDPTWGMRGDMLVKRYQEAVIAGMNASQTANTTISIDKALAEFGNNPLYFKENLPEFHKMGLRAVEDTRGLKATLPSMALKGLYEPLANSQNDLVAWPSNLVLKIPMLFSTYGSNVLIKVLGLQGFNAAAAMMLDGRRKPWAKLLHADENGKKVETFDMSPAIESLDLMKEFMQSSISLTSLFAFGMLAGSLGLSGEDEETKRRKRMAYYQGWQFMYDPLQIENDWRNQDAIFLDNIPGLNALFAVTTKDDASGYRSMAKMHWIVKQFVSPLLGFERYMETGDWRQIMWGFEDAVSSFPIINLRTWTDATSLAKELAAASRDQEQLGTDLGAAKGYGFMTQLVMTYEQMLFENSFVNALYVMSDEYDRDPYVQVERDEYGNIISDRMVNPEGTNALDTFQDPVTGEIRQGYTKNDDTKAFQMGRAEKNLSYALFKSLTTGNFNLSESPWIRQNMAVKQRKINLEGVDTQTAKDLILSIWNNETGMEELTYDGDRVILNGIAAKSLTLDSPVLQGFYLTQDQRKQIEQDWFADLIVQGVELHNLSLSDAKSRAWDMWLGQNDYANVQGLRSIVYSKQIPEKATVTYNQLNTTYIQGPDGQMWATGIARDTLMDVLGLKPIKRFLTGNNQLGVDERLNNTDAVFNLNTGMRGLKRQEESYHVKTDEELLKESMDDLKEFLKKNFNDIKDNSWVDWSKGYGNPRYRSRGYSRGGSSGGGGGYAPRVDIGGAIREPYYKDVRIADAGNVSIRRANLRRERFSSDRGRLKPWQ